MKILSLFLGLIFVPIAPWIVFAFPETPELVRSNVSSLDRNRDWPGWRGPTHDGVSPSSKAPTSWNDSKNIRWVADVPGRGNASPTIVGDCVYLPTCTEESGAQSVLCFDRKTGSQKWSLEVHPSGAVRKNERSTGASSSIASDGQQLFVCFPNNDSVVLSSISLDGKLQWSKRFSDYLVHQGYGASPFLYGSTVIVVADHRGGGTLAALSKKDGSVVWQRERPKDPNYPSPIVHKLFDREQLILIGCDRVISYDPRHRRDDLGKGRIDHRMRDNDGHRWSSCLFDRRLSQEPHERGCSRRDRQSRVGERRKGLCSFIDLQGRISLRDLGCGHRKMLECGNRGRDVESATGRQL